MGGSTLGDVAGHPDTLPTSTLRVGNLDLALARFSPLPGCYHLSISLVMSPVSP